MSKDSVKNIAGFTNRFSAVSQSDDECFEEKILFHSNQSKVGLHAVTSVLIATLLQMTKMVVMDAPHFLFQFHVVH